MSTWMYLTCTDHTPPIVSEEESGQHHYDLPRIFSEVKNRRELVEQYEQSPQSLDYFARNSARFLKHHPDCVIEVRSEYGQVMKDEECSERPPKR